MSMEKHGNQLFPEDRVRVLRVSNSKSASAAVQTGNVVAVDPSTGIASVRMALINGETYTESFPLSDLEKIND